MKVKRPKELDELCAKQRAASAKMKGLETASGEALEQVEKTADRLWEDLKAGVSDAHAKFK